MVEKEMYRLAEDKSQQAHCYVRLMYWCGAPILNPTHTPKKTTIRRKPMDCYTCVPFGGLANYKRRIGQVEDVSLLVPYFWFNVAFVGKSKFQILVGNELRGKPHQYMGLCRSLSIFITFLNERWKFTIITACLGVKREPKYTLIDFAEEAKVVEHLDGIGY